LVVNDEGMGIPGNACIPEIQSDALRGIPPDRILAIVQPAVLTLTGSVDDDQPTNHRVEGSKAAWHKARVVVAPLAETNGTPAYDRSGNIRAAALVGGAIVADLVAFIGCRAGDHALRVIPVAHRSLDPRGIEGASATARHDKLSPVLTQACPRDAGVATNCTRTSPSSITSPSASSCCSTRLPLTSTPLLVARSLITNFPSLVMCSTAWRRCTELLLICMSLSLCLPIRVWRDTSGTRIALVSRTSSQA